MLEILNLNWEKQNNGRHLGEVARLHEGWIGWLDCTGGSYSRPGVSTAMLEVVTDKFEIFVYKKFRNKAFDAGTDLMRSLIKRLIEFDYQEFLIIGAIDDSIAFYNDVIATLETEHLVDTHTIIPTQDLQTRDNTSFRLKLAKNNPSYQIQKP